MNSNLKSHKKIVLSVLGFPQISETFIVDKFLGLLKKGWDVHLVCEKRLRGNESFFPGLAERSRGRVHEALPASRLLVPLYLSWALGVTAAFRPASLLRYFISGLRRNGIKTFIHFYLDFPFLMLKPDLIHFEFGTLAVQKMRLKKSLGASVAVSFRGFDINYSGLENPHYYRMVWRDSDWIHCLGKDLWQRAQQRGCPKHKPLVIIPPSVDADFFRPSPRPGRSPGDVLRILSVGRLTWVKGYEFALQALGFLKKQGVPFRYVIIGDGPYFESLHFTLSQLGLENQVEISGALSREKVKRQLADTDVFLHAAVSEGFCNAVLEAQAMEVPVVSSDAGGLPENVADGVTGFVVPRRDPAALCRKLHYFFENPDVIGSMGAAGRKRVLERFTAARQVDDFSKTYHNFIAKR